MAVLGRELAALLAREAPVQRALPVAPHAHGPAVLHVDEDRAAGVAEPAHGRDGAHHRGNVAAHVAIGVGTWYRPPMSARLEVRVMGAIQASLDGVPVQLAGPKSQALLALLALAAPHEVTSERLVEEVWVDDLPHNPANALQALVSQLRRVLGADAVIRRGTGYALRVAPDDVDATRLQRLVREGLDAADRHDHTSAADRFGTALSLVRGPPLVDLPDHHFARETAARLGEGVLTAHEGLAEAQLATGRHADAALSLRELVVAHPLRERFRVQLILALYRGGRQADALRAYQDARHALLEELGLEPGPELRALESAVLRHDPELLRSAPERPATPAPLVSGPRHASDPSADGPATGEEPAPARFPLIGRDAELRALLAESDGGQRGVGRVALLGGEPGIGKTRLAEELAAPPVSWAWSWSGAAATRAARARLLAVDPDRAGLPRPVRA